MAKILIVGCGDIGTRLAQLLIKDGHQVTGLRRRPPETSAANMDYFKADITCARELDELPTDFEQLFFIVSPDGRNADRYRAVYDSGVEHLLGRFSRRRPPWIFVSSASVYGQSQGEWVDEDSPAQPLSATSRLIREAEKRLITADRDNIVVRFSGIYGAGRESLLTMAQQAPAIQRDPPYYTNRIHQQDCAEVLAFLFKQFHAGRCLNQCYLASDDVPVPLWEIVTWLAEGLHCRPPAFKAARAGAAMNKRCDNRRLKALGYRFRYPSYREGYAEMLGNFSRFVGD
ncbi:MAG: SDR family oxidoreductase [Gammaproteobacteria bacterium]